MAIEPITLDRFGNTLESYPPCAGFDPTTMDPRAYELTSCIGVHAGCNGFVDRHRISNTHVCLSCRQCNMQIYVPISIETWNDLEVWAAEEAKG